MKSETLIGFLLILASTICQAQNNSNSQTINWTNKTGFFVKPELLVDSTFIEKVTKTLLDQDERLSSYPDLTKKIDIRFERKDSLYDYVEISLDPFIYDTAIGFYKQNGIRYWLYGDLPPDIILGETEVRERFRYPNYCITYDPLSFYFVYNLETGIFEAIEEKNIL